MNFAGWSLGVLGPLFLGGATIITGLYLLRMRRREVVVPFAALWTQVARQSESRQLWKRLRRVLSWLLQIAILALLCLALGDPRPEAWFREPQSVAIIIDRSASMSAAANDGGTRLQAAVARATAELATLRGRDRALVITAGPSPALVTPLTEAERGLSIALNDLDVAYGEADLSAALALAEQALAAQPQPRILVLTDAALDGAGLQALERCAAGEIACAHETIEGPDANVSISAFATRRLPHVPDRVEVLTEVHNWGDEAATFDVDIEADGVSLVRRRVELAPGEVRRDILADVDAARAHLVARLRPTVEPAPLAGPTFDDVAHAVIPPLAPLDVAWVSDGTDLFLEAALISLGDAIRLTPVSLADAASAPPPTALAEADLIVLDPGAEPLPERLPPTNRVYFDPWRHATSPCPIAKKADVARPFLTEQDRRHPIFAHVVLKDVNIARGTTLAAMPGDTVLARSLGDPVIVLREGDAIDLAIGFDPRQSDFALRTAFPLLLDNIVRYIGQRSPGFVAAVPVGTSPPLALAPLGLDPRGLTRVRVSEDGRPGTDVPVEHGHIRVQTERPGLVTLVAVDGPSAGARVELAAQLQDPRASDLHARAPDVSSPPRTTEPAPVDPGGPWDRPLWVLLVLAVAVVVAIEWATYHRRMTV